MKTTMNIDAKSVGSTESNGGFSSRFRSVNSIRQDPFI